MLIQGYKFRQTAHSELSVLQFFIAAFRVIYLNFHCSPKYNTILISVGGTIGVWTQNKASSFFVFFFFWVGEWGGGLGIIVVTSCRIRISLKISFTYKHFLFKLLYNIIYPCYKSRKRHL